VEFELPTKEQLSGIEEKSELMRQITSALHSCQIEAIQAFGFSPD